MYRCPGDGFDFGIDGRTFQSFVTAYDQYAMRPDVHAVDPLKPIDRSVSTRGRTREPGSRKMPAPTELSAAARQPQQFL
jgi:hypothetical protein